MDNIVPLLYLSILLLALATLSVFIGGQILERKRIENNLSSLQNKIRNNNADADDYYELGSIYLSKKLFDQAIMQFRYALQIWKSEDFEGISNLYNTIGFTYAETEQYELAMPGITRGRIVLATTALSFALSLHIFLLLCFFRGSHRERDHLYWYIVNLCISSFGGI